MGARRGNGISLATAYVTLTADGSEIAKAIGQGLNQGQKQATSTGRAMGKAISDGVGKQDPFESLNKAQENAKRKAADLAKAEQEAARRREDAAAKVEIAKRKVEEADERAARAAEKSGKALDEAAPNSSQLTAYDRLRRAQNDYADEVAKSETHLDGMRDAQEKANKAVKDAEQATKGAEKSTEKAGGAFSRMGDRIKAALHGDFKGAFKPIETEAKESAGKAEDELNDIGDDMEPVGNHAGVGFGRAFMGAIAALGIGAAISSQIKSGFESATDQQNITATMAGLYGDADKAAGTLQKIKDLSKTSPIDYKAYGDAANSLAYAGVEGDKAVKILDKVGWAVQGAGGGAEELDRAMNGLLKGVNNGGIVMNDTLNMISESGYPIINGLQEKFNTTGDVIKKMASKGEISIEDVLSVMENGTGELAKKQEAAGKKGAEGFGKQWQMAKDNIRVAIGETMIPLLEQVAPVMKPVSDAIVGIVKKIPALTEGIKSAFGWMKDNSGVLKVVAGGLTAIGTAAVIGAAPGLFAAGKAAAAAKWESLMASKAFSGMWKALTGPIGWVIAIVTAVTAALVWFFTKTETGQKLWAKIWPAIKNAVAAVVDWFKNTALPFLAAAWDKIAQGAQWLYNNVIQPVWSGIKVAIAVVVGWIMNTAVPFLQSAWQAIATAAQWLWHNVIQPVWTGIKVAIALVVAVVMTIVQGWVAFFKNVVAPIFTWLWHNIIQPVWSGIKAAISAVVSWFQATAWPILKRVINFIKAYFAGLKNGLGAIWSWIKNKIINPVVAWFRDTVAPLFQRVIGAIQKKFTAFKVALAYLWANIKAKIIAPVANWFRDHVAPLIARVVNSIRDKFQWFKDKLSAIWQGIKNAVVKPVVDWFMNTIKPKIDTFVDKVKSAFDTMKKGVKKAWDGIKKTAMAPIRFVIDTVLNKGIIKNFNKVAGTFGVSPISEIKAGFSSGGYTGPGRKYQPAGLVHADEFVVRKSSRRSIERTAPGLLDGLNKYGARALPFGGYAGGGKVGDDGGGIKGWVSDRWQDAKKIGSDVYEWTKDAAGFVADVVTDPKAAFSKLVDGLVKAVPGAGKMLEVATAFPKKIAAGIGQMLSETFAVDGGYGAGGGAISGAKAIQIGSSKLGAKYVWGAEGPTTFDCSGFTKWVYAQLGSILPRTSSQQRSAMPRISKGQAKPGDLAFWPGHVGLFAGGNKVLHASHSRWKVMYSDLWGSPTFGHFSNAANADGTYRSVAARALKMTGDYSEGNLNSLLARMRKESGMNPHAINKWDSNAKKGTPSKGLMQLIDPTFKAYAYPGYMSNIWDPLSNILASIRYTKRRYGSLQKGWGRAGGYANGGWTGAGAKYAPAGIVHADEHVIRRESRASIERAAPGFLDRLNRFGAKALGLGGYAKGGRVSKVRSSRAKAKQIVSVDFTKSQIGSFIDGLTGTGKQARKAADRLYDSIVSALKKSGRSAKQVKKATQAIWAGIAKPATKRLIKLADKSDTLAKKLKSAEASLSDQRKAKADYKSSMTDKLREGYSLSADSANLSVKVLASDYKQATKEANTFTKQLAQLKKKGLDTGLVDQIAQLGTADGSAVAKNILGGSAKDIKALSKQYLAFNKSTASGGKTLANTMYNDGINGAKGLVKGLTSQSKAVEKASAKLANKVVKTVRKKLKIHSPSRVMADLGSYTGQGFVRGVDGQAKAAQKSLTRLTAVPSVGVPQMSASSSNVVVTRGDGQTIVNVQRGPQEDPTRLGRRVAETLDLYRLSAAV